MFKKHRQKAIIEIRQLTEKEVKHGMPHKVLDGSKEIEVNVSISNRKKVEPGDVIIKSLAKEGVYSHMKYNTYINIYEPIE